MLLSTKRIIKDGILKFWRNGWLSVATILVMIMTLSMIAGLLFLSVLSNGVLTNLADKIDVSVYFKNDASEADILKVKDDLMKFGGVQKVEYVSKEEALIKFRLKHNDNTFIKDALDELGANPLQASLNVKANAAYQYEGITKFLEREEYQKIIDKINFRQNQKVIEKFSGIIDATRTGTVLLITILGFIAVLMSYNTIRLAIFTSQEEISIMRLVGASNFFIRGPFLVEGVAHGGLAALATAGIYEPLLGFISPKLAGFMPGIDIAAYYSGNFFQIFGFLFGIGLFLGVIGSYIAMRRYLRV